jgi:hypothetical protein
MSQEQQDKTDDAAHDTAPTTDTAGQPSSGPKKSPLIAIIAVIVVIALIATAFSVLMMGGQPSHPELSVRVSPMSVAIANGSQIRLTPYATFKNSSSDPGINVSAYVSLSVNCKWSAGSSQIGILTRGKTTDGLAYYMLKSNMTGTSSLNWSFKYVDENLVSYDVYKKVNVNVSAAVLSYIEINPAEKVMFKGKSQLFTAKALLTNDTEALSTVFSWYLSDPNVGSITPVNGSSTTLKAGLVNASGDLVCNGTHLGKTVSSTAKIKVLTVLPPSSTNTRVYNLLSVPLGGWWVDRYQEQVIRSTYPVAYEWFGTPAGNTWLYSSCSLNVVANYTTKANTSEKPWYVPVLNPTVRGGTIDIDWTGTYLTKAQAQADYQKSIADWYDSWFWRFSGNVTMDKTAAKMVMNMTDVDIADFPTWKADKFPIFKQKFSIWLTTEMNTVWAIKFAYEYEGNTLYEAYDVEKVGDNIVFKILDHLSWGAESLLGRWWRETFLQYEGWPDDMHFVAQITPLWSNFTLDMTPQYWLTAMNSTRDGRTSWVLEVQRADAVQGSNGDYDSEFNQYFGKETWSKLIANSAYMTWRDFDYTPTAWSLGTNDSITVEWPGTTSTVMGYDYNGTNNCNKTASGKLTPLWIEPVPGEVPSNVFINNTARTITIQGPFDATQWSKTTLADREIRENWSKLNILPWGIPRIEFVVNNDANQKPIAALAVPKIWGTNTSHALGSGSFDIDGSIVSYEWSFGDGSPNAITAAPTTTHTWVTQANCTVSLKVTDDDGLWAIDSTMVQIVDNLPPVADLNNSNVYGDIQTPTLFNGDGSYDQNAGNDNSTIVSYQWDFGDGNTSVTTTSRTSHLYAEMGIYDVTLTVVDDLGATDSDTVTFAITTDLCAKIVMQRSATVGDSVVIKGNRSFTFSASHGRTLANWTWDFGDGSSGYGQNVTHAWSSAGVFTVNLFVKDNLGLQSQNATARIVIATATVTGLGLSLARHSLLPGESTTLTIKAVNDAGKVVTSFSGNVLLTVNGSGWTLPSPTALVAGVKSVTVSCTTPGSYNITAAVQGTPSQNGSIFATVNNRTVEIKIYGIFEPGLPDYWLKRSQYYLLADEGFRNYTPSIEIYRVGVNTAGQLSTTYIMYVEARNIQEINMSSPTYTALRNPTTGKGNVTVVIDFHQMTEAEVYARDGIYYPVGKAASWDGWEYFLTYNATMDRAAAEQIINLPSASWASQADVDTWWATNNLTVNRVWNRNVYLLEPGYLGAEGGYGVFVGRLDLKSCEDYYNYGQGLWNTVFRLQYIDANHVSLVYFNVGYGYDALITRFLYWGGPGSGPNYPNGTPNGIIPYEPWFDNMSLRVDISDDHANVSMYGAVVYGFRAWASETAPAGTAAFRMELIRLDYLLTGATGLSEMDIYAPYRNISDPRYQLRDPGSSLMGETTKYDYVPAVITLKPGESIFMQSPRTMAVGYLPQRMIGDYADGSNYLGGYYDFLKIIEVFGNATIHPIGCYPGTYTLDKEMGDMTIVGPFVPIIIYRSDITWLVYEPAPRIELWIQ